METGIVYSMGNKRELKIQWGTPRGNSTAVVGLDVPEYFDLDRTGIADGVGKILCIGMLGQVIDMHGIDENSWIFCRKLV